MMPLALTVIIWLLVICMCISLVLCTYCLFKSGRIRECTPALVLLILVAGAVFWLLSMLG